MWIYTTVVLLVCVSPRCVTSDCSALEHALPAEKRFTTLPETTQKGYYITNVTLSSSDQVSLDNEDPPGYFVLNGRLDLTTNNTMYSLQLNQDLDLEQLPPRVYSVAVRLVCYPGSWKYTIRIQIAEVNEFAPVFVDSPYYVEISESVVIGTTVFNLANRVTDPDKRLNPVPFSYAIHENEAFVMLDTAVVTRTRFDYDFGTRKYSLNLTATELTSNGKSNSTTLTVTLLNEDDLNPKFTQNLYNIALSEGIYSGAMFNTIPPLHADDLDFGNSTPIQYSFTAGTQNAFGHLFTLLPNGSLVISGALDLRQAVYSLSIKAFQTDRPLERYDTATLFVTVVDVNDHAPQMSNSSYVARVEENSPVGLVVLVVSASDQDTGKNRVFEFGLKNDENLFDVETVGTSGWVRVRGRLDREKSKSHTLQIYARETLTDELKSSVSSNITILVTDVNDNSPVFNNNTYRFQIPKIASVGQFVGTVFATDLDEGINGTISYTIQRTLTSLLTVNQTTGAIRVGGNLGDDSVGVSELFVIARDGAPQPYTRWAVVSVRVDVMDVNTGPPLFTNLTDPVHISENQNTGAIVFQLSARDPDSYANSHLTYALTEGNINQTFALDTRSGLLSVRKILDREAIAAYDLTVQVSDGELTTTAVLRVLVTDLNDNAPQFTQQSYVFNITEERPPETVVGQVTATDLDDGMNKKITFYTSGSSFVINSTTGVIATRWPLDQEEDASFSFLVTAVDGGHPPLTGIVEVHVTVDDINDNAPVFDPPLVRLKYKEGTMLSFTAQAQDPDSGDNKEVHYYKEEGDAMFSVSLAGHVTSDTALQQGSFKVVVVAYNTQPYSSSCSCQNATLTILIDVSDVNNNPPVFNTTLYNITIPEGSHTSKKAVIKLSATDMDTDSTILYYITSGNVDSTFYLNPVSGGVYAQRELDYDPPVNDRIFNLTVQAVDPSNEKHNDVAQVVIYITDINDHAPIFDRENYECQVSESTKPHNWNNCQVMATDLDSRSNGEVRYTLQTQNVPFQINSDNGRLSLESNLDYELQKQYTLKIIASDLGIPNKTRSCTVVVRVQNENDNSPYFPGSPYSFSILHTVAVGSVVGVVGADDADGDVLMYSLKNHTQNFQIDSRGQLTIKAALGCERSYYIWLQVNDSINVNETVVLIKSIYVNTFSPSFTDTYQSDLMENATEGHTVLQISSVDGDCGEGGQVTLSIVGGNWDDAFRVSGAGVLTVACTSCLDYETHAHYELLVEAHDGGIPPRMNFTLVNISLIDVNDEPPTFDRPVYTGRVLENEKDGVTILQVVASDRDSPSNELVYSLLSPMSGLSLSPAGLLTNSGPLDADGGHFTLTGNVSVTDGIHSDIATIHISVMDVNDNFPVLFLQPSNVSVPENSEIGSIIFEAKATDKDRTNQGFTYWLTNAEGKFEIDSVNGGISVADYFDRSLEDAYNITVHVSDHGIPPKFSEKHLAVSIEDSNNAPVFWNTPYIFNVPENTALHTVVGAVYANDSDRGSSGTVEYEISQGNEDDTFRLNSYSGNISLIKPLNYESKTGPVYVLTVVAKDLSFVPKTATATVMIKVENIPEAPVWSSPLPTVLVQTAASCKAFRVTAFSQDVTYVFSSDGSVVYSLHNYKHVFSIEKTTGILRANMSLTTRGKYVLKLRACNANYTDLCSNANLTIDVRSDNSLFSFCPAFISVSVKEGVLVGHVVVDLNTTLGDRGISYVITDGNEDQMFHLNSSQGVLTTARELDRETMDHYTLLVEGHSKKQIAQAQVIIKVLDVKDSRPRFVQGVYLGRVSESAPIHDPVLVDTDGPASNLTVVAVDLDLDTQLTYSILSSSDSSNGSFSVGRSSGAIEVRRRLDREGIPADMHDEHTFQVTVSDDLYTATTTVTVRVLDENDNAAYFEADVVNISVSENTMAGSVIYQATAQDVDYVDRGQLKYTIYPNDVFSVHPDCGNVSVVLVLDRESVSSYGLSVVVTDLANHTTEMELNILISDENDNSPQFNESQYFFNIVEGTSSINESIVVVAHDDDTGNNSVITFSIVSGNEGGMFAMTTKENKGKLTVVREIDREDDRWRVNNGTAVILLTVEAVDGGFPPLKAVCDVVVHVLDVNDNSPSFGSSVYNSTVSEGAATGTVLAMVPAIVIEDPDNAMNGTEGVRYRLRPEDIGTFGINTTSGQVSVQSADLDREKRAVYTLQIVAQDAGGTGNIAYASLVIDVLDVNDVDPVFVLPYYTFNVSEDARPSDVAGQVTAFDDDVHGNHSLRYSLVSGDDFRFFIDRITGVVKVSGGLDREVKATYNLNVSASDGKYSTFIPIVVNVGDVNDNCPTFSDSHLQYAVGENEKPTSLGRLTAADPDNGINGSVRLFLNDTDIEEYFEITDTELRTTREIDRETINRFAFRIFASDYGEPPCISYTDVSVEIMDKNDNDPIFCENTVCDNSPKSIVVFEEYPVQSVVTLMSAVDADVGQNAAITYSLLGQYSDYFKINKQTGVVTVLKTLRNVLTGDSVLLDSTIQITVLATDNGHVKRNGSVTLNMRIETVKERVPAFEESAYHFTVTENIKPGSPVGAVQASLSSVASGPLVYSITGTAAIAQAFAIQETHGTISTVIQLDREARQFYSFVVQVRNDQNPEWTAFTLVIVNVSDENDNAPYFLQNAYSFEIEENAEETILLNITAVDIDSGENGRLSYSLVNNTYEILFAVDTNTGQIKLIGSLNREVKDDYLLFVQARDHGSPPLSAITSIHITVLDRNDEYPQFQNLPYVVSISKNENQIANIIKVLATDRDIGLNGQVIYRIIGDGYNSFQIDAVDGSISTLGALGESCHQGCVLQVMAHDLGIPSLNTSAEVVIHINGSYHSPPKFTKQLYVSEVAIGTPRYTNLRVGVDAGNGSFYYNISQGNSDGLFAVDPETAAVTVAKELESLGQHLLTVTAFDLISPHTSSSTQVLVTVVEPKIIFVQTRYEAHVSENLRPPVMVVDLNSSAETQGSRVVYQLIDGPRDTFKVDGSTGQVFCTRSLDREKISGYRLRVKVSGPLPSKPRQGRSVRRDIAEVVVKVDDVNDNDPVFRRPRTYTNNTAILALPQSAGHSYRLTTVSVTDEDEEVNSEVKFTLVDDHQIFAIYNPTGEIVTLREIASINTDTIYIRVIATDENGMGRSTYLNMKVVILSDEQQFGLSVGMSPSEFIARKDLLIGNLTNILGFDVRLEQSIPQNLSRTNLYLHAFDKLTGKIVSFDEIEKKTRSKSQAINDLFSSHTLFTVHSPTTAPPLTVAVTRGVRQVQRYAISKAQIAILAIAAMMFIGSLLAIVAVIRIWKQHEAFLVHQQLAERARKRQPNTQIEQDGPSDEGFNEINADSDNTEIVDTTDVIEEADDESPDFSPKTFLKPTKMSEISQKNGNEFLCNAEQFSYF